MITRCLRYVSSVINGRGEARPSVWPGGLVESINVPSAKGYFTVTGSKPTISTPLFPSQDLIRSMPLLGGYSANPPDIKFSAKNTTKKKRKGKTLKDENGVKSRAEQLIQNLENDEYREEMTKALAIALKTNIAVAEQYLRVFMLTEEELLDLVTKSATIKEDVRKRVLNGLTKSLEKRKND